jgi:hypothetical protein
MLAAGRRAADLYRELGERSKLAYVLALLGFALHQIKRTDEADRATAEAVAIAREEGDHWHIAFVLCYRALTIDSTEIGARRALLDESARLWGNLGEEASVELLILSLVAFAADDLLRALRWARESLAGYRRLNFRGAIAMCQVYVAAYSLAAGDVDAERRTGSGRSPVGVRLLRSRPSAARAADSTLPSESRTTQVSAVARHVATPSMRLRQRSVTSSDTRRRA